jgi:hypothetical protein
MYSGLLVVLGVWFFSATPTCGWTQVYMPSRNCVLTVLFCYFNATYVYFYPHPVSHSYASRNNTNTSVYAPLLCMHHYRHFAWNNRPTLPYLLYPRWQMYCSLFLMFCSNKNNKGNDAD